ncbi:hypothetical protein F53441_783 [Fusarium austroafricanum]|uniref:Uncharacterized protein n=1 Tax=Fusarium austroafricanum TaxID=2364996 RepID=A0A8H4KWZ8_9HYPO|nr:hypothetical protein F53441_783 [Fusarium austroafricanum]
MEQFLLLIAKILCPEKPLVMKRYPRLMPKINISEIALGKIIYELRNRHELSHVTWKKCLEKLEEIYDENESPSIWKVLPLLEESIMDHLNDMGAVARLHESAKENASILLGPALNAEDSGIEWWRSRGRTLVMALHNEDLLMTIENLMNELEQVEDILAGNADNEDGEPMDPTNVAAILYLDVIPKFDQFIQMQGSAMIALTIMKHVCRIHDLIDAAGYGAYCQPLREFMGHSPELCEMVGIEIVQREERGT